MERSVFLVYYCIIAYFALFPLVKKRSSMFVSEPYLEINVSIVFTVDLGLFILLEMKRSNK